MIEENFYDYRIMLNNVVLSETHWSVSDLIEKTQRQKYEFWETILFIFKDKFVFFLSEVEKRFC